MMKYFADPSHCCRGVRPLLLLLFVFQEAPLLSQPHLLSLGEARANKSLSEFQSGRGRIAWKPGIRRRRANRIHSFSFMEMGQSVGDSELAILTLLPIWLLMGVPRYSDCRQADRAVSMLRAVIPRSSRME